MACGLFWVPWQNGRPDLALSEDDAKDGLTGYSVAEGQEITSDTARARVLVYADAAHLAAMRGDDKFEAAT